MNFPCTNKTLHCFSPTAARLAAVCAALLLTGASSFAALVTYSAIDKGASNWTFDYSITGPVDMFGSVTLEFDANNYSGLVASTTDPLHLFVLELQPLPGLLNGFVTAHALADIGATDTAKFSVDFTWLGTGSPGSQPFEVADSFGNPAGGGNTALAGGTVPTPGTLALALAGLGLVATSRRRMAKA